MSLAAWPVRGLRTRPEVARIVRERHGLDYSPERIRLIEERAIEKLRRTLRRTLGERIVANSREVNAAETALADLEEVAAVTTPQLRSAIEIALRPIRLIVADARAGLNRGEGEE